MADLITLDFVTLRMGCGGKSKQQRVKLDSIFLANSRQTRPADDGVMPWHSAEAALTRSKLGVLGAKC